MKITTVKTERIVGKLTEKDFLRFKKKLLKDRITAQEFIHNSVTNYISTKG